MERLLKSLGVEEATEKVVPPTTHMEFLRNTVDTIDMSLEVSEHRRQELMLLITRWLDKMQFTLKQLQVLIGKLSFIMNCIRAGRIFMNRMLGVLRTIKDDKPIAMNQQIKHDLHWWAAYLPKFDGISILWLQDCLTIDHWLASDASLTGGGGTHDKQYFHLRFSDRILKDTEHIAQRELLTTMIAIKLWAPELKGKIVKFSTDNQWSMHAINSGAP